MVAEGINLKTLGAIPFLRGCSGPALRDVARHAVWYCLPSGAALFVDKEPADTIWFVLSGSLGAFRPGPDERQEFAGHIRKGEPVGEFALVANEPHVGSVYAMRDSEVLALDRAVFNRLIRRHPELMANLARTILFRSRQNRRKNPRAEPKVFAFISASSSVNLQSRTQALVEALARMGKRATIVHQDAQHQNSAWFDQTEMESDFVILLSDAYDTPWAQICRRRADRIWIFGRSDIPPSQKLRVNSNMSTVELFQLVDLILISAPGARAPNQTRAWLDAVSPHRHFHWHDDLAGSRDALVRVIAGVSIGLTLGGGGARAYAHIGAIRALREVGVQFDFVGGTSMGGVVGACLASGWHDDEIERRIYNAFVASSPLDDYHLPVVSMTAGKKVDQRLALHFKDAKIEEMRIPFFCVSSNLTTGSLKLHQGGLLRDALRASIALPGILPPVVLGDEVLADGAILDNLPVSAMRETHRGFNIAVDVAQKHNLDPEDFRHPMSFAAWVTRYGFKRAPPVAELLMRAATATAPTALGVAPGEFLIVPELEGVQLRDWKAFDRAVEAGYQATMSALKSAPGFIRAPKA